MYEPKTVANWLLAWADEEFDASVTASQLCKLLYYAQAHHIVETCHGLFKDEDQTCVCADDQVMAPPAEDEFSWDEVTEKDGEYLVKLWNTYYDCLSGL